jgi:hypothetical protein
MCLGKRPDVTRPRRLVRILSYSNGIILFMLGLWTYARKETSIQLVSVM